jgi:hypothetical protein
MFTVFPYRSFVFVFVCLFSPYGRARIVITVNDKETRRTNTADGTVCVFNLPTRKQCSKYALSMTRRVTFLQTMS